MSNLFNSYYKTIQLSRYGCSAISAYTKYHLEKVKSYLSKKNVPMNFPYFLFTVRITHETYREIFSCLNRYHEFKIKSDIIQIGNKVSLFRKFKINMSLNNSKYQCA